MPLYEYYCNKCDRIVEELLSPDGLKSIVFCKLCGKQMKKILSAVNFKCERADGKKVEG